MELVPYSSSRNDPYARVMRIANSLYRASQNPRVRGMVSMLGKRVRRKWDDIGSVYKRKKRPQMYVAPVSRFRAAGVGGRKYRRRRGTRGRRLSKRVRYARKQMYRIARRVSKPIQTCKCRYMDSGQISVDVNTCAYYQYSFLGASDIEARANQCLYTAKTTGSTPYTAAVGLDNLADPNDKLASYKVMRAQRRFRFRNNAIAPVNMEVTWYGCKESVGSDSANLPVSLWAQGFLDSSHGLTEPNVKAHLQFNIRDRLLGESEFHKTWRMFKKRDYKLCSGDEVDVKMNRRRALRYSAEYIDNAGLEYMAKKSQVIVIRLSGVPSHDGTATGNVGTSSGTLDFVVTDTYDFDVNPRSIKHRFYTVYAGQETAGAALDAQAAGATVGVDEDTLVEEKLT